MNHLPDEELVNQYKTKRDEQSLEVLVKRYLPQIYGFARNYTGNRDNASDIAQEVFVKVWKNINKFDESKSFRTWIFTIAKNTSIDWLKRRTELPLDESFDLADDSPSVLEQLMLKEKSGKLSFALAKLPAHYSSIINLYIKDDLNFREISETLKVPLNTVKSQYRRGLALLKKIL
jgi:RNA polymerase sigma-70 factor (ECF subfamily)